MCSKCLKLVSVLSMMSKHFFGWVRPGRQHAVATVCLQVSVMMSISRLRGTRQATCCCYCVSTGQCYDVHFQAAWNKAGNMLLLLFAGQFEYDVCFQAVAGGTPGVGTEGAPLAKRRWTQPTSQPPPDHSTRDDSATTVQPEANVTPKTYNQNYLLKKAQQKAAMVGTSACVIHWF